MEEENKIEKNENEKSPVIDGVITFLSYFFVLPVFIIFHKILPDPNWPLFLDRILLATAIYFLIRILLNAFKPIILVGFVLAICWLTYGSIWGKYGYINFYNDYKVLLYSMANSPNPEHIAINEVKSFPLKSQVTAAVDYKTNTVRNLAVKLASKNFYKFKESMHNKHRVTIQSFSIFKEINSRWNYVSDPESSEYFAKASETADLFAGDCDDHAVFMSACIKAIGGRPRMIHTTGHLYPEIYIGNKQDLEEINYLIREELFVDETKGNSLHYHVDENDNIWLNLDYTERYPGGRFMDEEILGIILLDD